MPKLVTQTPKINASCYTMKTINDLMKEYAPVTIPAYIYNLV